MKVEPSAADLMAIAREAILSEIAPALPEDRRYAALMAANALAIAGRELAAGPSAAAEIARIGALLGDWIPPADEAAALREGTTVLARRIREGRFDDGEARRRLLEHLAETTRSRLAVSNPRALARNERKSP
jgi:hypothetical protein